jgi:hypothetical protein
MLGALHRILSTKTWYSSGTAGWEGRVAGSVKQLVAAMEAVRTETIAETGMTIVARRGAQYHKDCTPWTACTVFDVQSAFNVGDLVPVDDGHFRKQKMMSGVKALGPRGPRFFS